MKKSLWSRPGHSTARQVPSGILRKSKNIRRKARKVAKLSRRVNRGR